jgi:hypothetical protein
MEQIVCRNMFPSHDNVLACLASVTVNTQIELGWNVRLPSSTADLGVATKRIITLPDSSATDEVLRTVKAKFG